MKTGIRALALAVDLIESAGPQFDVDALAQDLQARLDWSVLSDPATLSFISKLLVREGARRMKDGAARAFENVERTGDDGEPTQVYKQYALLSGYERIYVFRAKRSQAESLVAACNAMRRVIREKDGVALPELRLVEVAAEEPVTA